VLPTVRTDELRTASEAADVEKYHAAERKFLGDYVMSQACDDDCRGRFVEYMLTGYAESEGDYDELMKRILSRPPAESGPSVGRLHARLARCQFDPADVNAFRDRTLVPALGDVLAEKKPEMSVVDNLVDLVALAPEPTDPTALAAWNAVLSRLNKQYPEKHHKWAERRAVAEAERRLPPPALKKVSFCKAAEAVEGATQVPE